MSIITQDAFPILWLAHRDYLFMPRLEIYWSILRHDSCLPYYIRWKGHDERNLKKDGTL